MAVSARPSIGNLRKRAAYSRSTGRRTVPPGTAPAFFRSGLLPIIPATLPNIGFIARLRHDETGKFFNTGTFVTDNGDYLPLAHDFDGLWYIDVDMGTDFLGSATLYIKESPATFSDIYIALPWGTETTLTEVKTSVDELNSRIDICTGKICSKCKGCLP